MAVCSLKILFVFTGLLGCNDDEVFDCEIDGSSESSEDVCAMEEVERCNGSERIDRGIGGWRWVES